MHKIWRSATYPSNF